MGRNLSAVTAALTLAAAAFAQPSSQGPLAPPANGPRRADATWTALRNCTVHVNPSTTLERATVVFRDGIITAVLPATGNPQDKNSLKPAAPPAGATVIDCEGLHLYPGFIDPYVEVDAPAPAGDASTRHWSPKVTPQRSALHGTGLDDRTADSLRKLGFTAAAISPRGGVFRGTSAVVSLAKPADDASAARPPVYLDNAFHSVAFEAGGGYPGSQMGAIAMIRQTLIDADWQQSARAAGQQVEPNCLDVLAPGAKDGRVTPILFNTDDDLEPLRCIKIADEFSRPYLILGSGSEYQRLDALKSSLAKTAALRPAGAPLLLPLNYPRTPDVSSIGKAANAELADLMHWEQAPTNPRRLAAADLSFAFTTAKLRDRADFRKNLQTAIKHGLTEQQALAALTTTPAALFNLAGTLGTIEQGKRANLVLADGPIFGDRTKLRTVYIDGRAHEITPAPIDLEGRWTVAFHGLAEDKPVERYLAIDKDNNVTVHRAGKSTRATKVAAERDRLSFAFDHEPLDGEKGIYVASAIIEYDGAAGFPARHSSASRLSGSLLLPDGSSITWTAQRTPPSPLIGNWKLTKADDQVFDPKAKDGVTLAITDSAVTITFTKPTPPTPPPAPAPAADQPPAPEAPAPAPATPATPGKPDANRVDTADGTEPPPEQPDAAGADQPDQPDQPGRPRRARSDNATVIRADNVALKNDSLTFTHDLAPIGGQGQSTDKVTLIPNGPGKDDDVLRGESTFSDGTKHTYEAVRTPREGTQVAPGIWATDEELARIKAIPDKLPTPFGPYGFEALPPKETVVFRNATLWTNGPDGVTKGVLVISDGKIVAVAPGADLDFPVPAGAKATIIDAQGKHITPGIIDAHSHTGISRGVNEGGQAVTSEVRIADVVNPDDVNWYRQLAGGVTTVLQLHGSANAIGGQSQTTKIRWGSPHPDDMHFEGAIPGIKFALGENPRRVNSSGATDRTTLPRYPNSRMGVEQIIRDRFTAAKEYLTKPATARRDLELEALAEILRGERLVHCHSYRQDEMVMLCNVAKDFNFRIGTLQHALEAYKVADYALKHTGGASGFADWWAYKVEVQDAIPGAFPIMHDVGLTVSYNSDSNELARRLNVDAAKAVKYSQGISPEQALKFITLNPARQLRIDNRVGSLEVGKDADIAVWSSDPLSAFSKAEMTFVDGRRLFSLEQDQQHRARITAERQRLIQKLLAESRPAAARRPDGAADAAPSPDAPRRRRPPQSADENYTYYMSLFTSGRQPNETPGECGMPE
jgi:imidazolonepropionase-like amidohydrolase